MARAYSRGSHRSLVLLSAPTFCAVCADARRVQLIGLPGMRGGGPVRCPHCSNTPRPIPILTLPMRQDIPRGSAA